MLTIQCQSTNETINFQGKKEEYTIYRTLNYNSKIQKSTATWSTQIYSFLGSNYCTHKTHVNADFSRNNIFLSHCNFCLFLSHCCFCLIVAFCLNIETYTHFLWGFVSIFLQIGFFCFSLNSLFTRCNYFGHLW